MNSAKGLKVKRLHIPETMPKVQFADMKEFTTTAVMLGAVVIFYTDSIVIDGKFNRVTFFIAKGVFYKFVEKDISAEPKKTLSELKPEQPTLIPPG